MEMKSRVKVAHNVEVEWYESAGFKHDGKGNVLAGKLVRVDRAHNMNVNSGLNFMREAISRDVTVMGFIAAGSDNTPAGAGQTALVAELGRVAILGYDDTATGAVRFRAIFESTDANGNWFELGIFNDATAGTMMTRTVLGASFTKDTSLSVRVNWTVTAADT